jgi:beta-glucosidase
MNKLIAASIVIASFVAWAALAQSGSSALPQLPGVSAADCRPSGEKPWTDAKQTPVCRALEALAQMTYEEKLNFRGALPRLGLLSGPGGRGGQAPLRAGVTVFPHENVLASSWDRSLAERVGRAMGEESEGRGTIFPMININRTWHWGRMADTFGEDPFLTAEMVVPEISAIQAQHVPAILKHYLANNQEIDRRTVDERIPERALNEIYLYAWKQAVERAKVAAVFCAYNAVNGAFSCVNRELLGTLRKWGFDGFVFPEPVSDSVAAINAGEDVLAPNVVDGLVKSGKLDASAVDMIAFRLLAPYFRIGVYDVPAPTVGGSVSTPEHRKLAEEVAEQGAVLLKNKGSVLPLAGIKSLAIIGDDAGKNASMQMTTANVPIENPSLPSEAIPARAGSAVKVSYEAGSPGLGPLPEMQGPFAASFYATGDLSGSAASSRTDAVVDLAKFRPPTELVPAPPAGGRGRGGAVPRGPWSARWTMTLTPSETGRYRFSITGSGMGKLYVDGALIATIMKSDTAMTVTAGANLTAGKTAEVKIEYVPEGRGANLRVGMQAADAAEVAAVRKAAKEADVAVVFAGERAGESMDRWSLTLPGDLDSVIEEVAAVNPRTVVVLNTAGPVAMPWIDKVAAVIWAGHPGGFDGSSIAALLFGDANPSGKLVDTFPVDERQGPATKPDEYPGDGKVANFDEGLLVGYRWYDAKNQVPLFPFGHGLSYTTFQYSDLKIAKNTVSVKITNSGKREGAEVAQLYVGAPAAAAEPPNQLKGFEKVWLKPGESKVAIMPLKPESLAVWDEAAHGWKVVPGDYVVYVGSSSRDIRLKGRLSVH